MCVGYTPTSALLFEEKTVTLESYEGKFKSNSGLREKRAQLNDPIVFASTDVPASEYQVKLLIAKRIFFSVQIRPVCHFKQGVRKCWPGIKSFRFREQTVFTNYSDALSQIK